MAQMKDIVKKPKNDNDKDDKKGNLGKKMTDWISKMRKH